MAKIETIEGIGSAYEEKLAGAGVTTVEQLLEKGASNEGRSALAAATEIPQKRIDSWVAMADLRRLAGIGGQFSELLVRSGVTSVGDLAKRDAAELRSILETANEEKNMVNKIPSIEKLGEHIAAAGSLEEVIS